MFYLVIVTERAPAQKGPLQDHYVFNNPNAGRDNRPSVTWVSHDHKISNNDWSYHRPALNADTYPITR